MFEQNLSNIEWDMRLLKIKEGEMVSLALGLLLGFAEEGEDDLELFWGEDFAGAGVAGGLKGGHEGFVGMDFVSEAFARTLPAMVGEVGHSKVLLVLIHNNEILIKQLAKGRN